MYFKIRQTTSSIGYILGIVLLSFLFFTPAVFASPSMLCDFETGENTNGPEGGGTGYFRGRTYDPLLVVTPGAFGTNYCVVYTSTPDQEKPQSFYIDSRESRTFIEEANGANRFSAWIKLPVGYTQASDRNFHMGTYTRDPEILSDSQGSHYYHYYSLPGSPYWTKIIANTHPCKKSGSKDEILDNPTAPAGWNYYDGFTRFYFHCKEYGSKPEGYWDWYIDEVEFYHEDEPENTVSINAVSCSYFGEGHFQINWHGEFRCWNNSHYEVRYSTSPITNANYLSAQIAPGCSNLSKVPGSYSWVKADFTISVQDNTIYYFAIKDLDSDNPYVTRIDYPVGDVEFTDNDPPGDIKDFTASPGDSRIMLSWSNPTDEDFAGVMIRYRTDRYPDDYQDGSLAVDKAGQSGANDSYVHAGLNNGTRYFYSGFTYDDSGNYSGTARVSATPQGTSNLPPSASVKGSPTTGEANTSLNFYGTGQDSDGTIVSYSWDFGDGGKSSGQNPVHTFTVSNTFKVTFTVTDNDGASGTESFDINITPDSTPPSVVSGLTVK